MTVLDRLRTYTEQHARAVEDEYLARENRNTLIRDARDAGHTLAQIAEAAEMSRERVHQITRGD